jgi:(2Fe-2S) ferredoxin
MESLGRPGCWAHLLVCTNARDASAGMPSCAGPGRDAAANGEAVWEALRAWVSAHGLLAKVWVTKTGCIGWCHAQGVSVAVYPEGELYRCVTVHDCAALIQRHLQPLLARRGR